MTENKRARHWWIYPFHKVIHHQKADLTMFPKSVINGLTNETEIHVIEYSEVERLEYEREAASALGHERIVNLESKLHALEQRNQELVEYCQCLLTCLDVTHDSQRFVGYKFSLGEIRKALSMDREE